MENTEASIQDQRAKSNWIYREAIAPGLDSEMTLNAILASTESPYQKIDVIDTYFGKTLVTDGKTQSAQMDEFAYHESLVHPALLRVTRDTPVKSVFIGGGGELATAREVLRHTSVTRVVMVDLDEAVVNVCKEHLPEWGGETVIQDPRFTLIVGDAYAYLMECQEKFDVIIMDISDPIEAGPGIALYTKEFYEHAVSLLTDHGVFVTQAGMADSIAPPDLEALASFAPIRNTLAAVFDSVLSYAVNIPSFGGDWGFIMAYRDKSVDWTRPHDGEIDSLIKGSISGGSDALRFYDGTTHTRIFALTKPFRKYLAKDDRIMTKENPIFMY